MRPVKAESWRRAVREGRRYRLAANGAWGLPTCVIMLLAAMAFLLVWRRHPDDRAALGLAVVWFVPGAAALVGILVRLVRVVALVTADGLWTQDWRGRRSFYPWEAIRGAGWHVWPAWLGPGVWVVMAVLDDSGQPQHVKFGGRMSVRVMRALFRAITERAGLAMTEQSPPPSWLLRIGGLARERSIWRRPGS